MRRTAAHASLAVAAVLAVAACGSSSADYKNDPRPPAPIVITGYISDQRVSVSPRSLGAGPISLIVTNQTGTSQRVTLESAGATGLGPRHQAGHGAHQPAGHGDAQGRRQARQLLGARRRRRHPCRAPEVGPERASAQNDLLQP